MSLDVMRLVYSWETRLSPADARMIAVYSPSGLSSLAILVSLSSMRKCCEEMPNSQIASDVLKGEPGEASAQLGNPPYAASADDTSVWDIAEMLVREAFLHDQSVCGIFSLWKSTENAAFWEL